jgi:Tfp pilus assembly PilM family ATPase
MGKRQVGLYFGGDSLGGIVMEKDQMVSFAHYELASLQEESKVENLNEDVKWEALINRALRDMGVEEKEVFLAVADKEFIFRSFEMPAMRKKELEAAVAFEVEKYIPFKLDQLRWDFTYKTIARDKKTIVSFIGIREASFQRFYDIVTRLDLEPARMEPSSLALVRMIKSFKRYQKLKNFALLDYTTTEAYLTFFHENMPVFNRYFTVPHNDAGETDLEKFIETIRVSFQYFQREMRSYQPGAFLVVADVREEKLAQVLHEELQTEVEILMPYDFLERAETRVENLKAAGIAVASDAAYSFRPDFLTHPEEKLKARAASSGVSLKGGLLVFLSGLAVFAVVFFSMVLNNIATNRASELAGQRSAMVRPSEVAAMSWDEVQADIIRKNKGSAVLAGLAAKPQTVSGLVYKIPRLLPQGLWLEKLEVNNSGEASGCRAQLSGAVFLADNNKERAAVDRFIADLSAAPDIRKLFSQVELVSSERKNDKGFDLTFFAIKME